MRMITLSALMVVGLLATTGIVSAYRGDYTVQGPNYDADREAAMEAAFAELDYDAWYDMMTEDGRHPRVVDVVTEENFATFVEARNAALAGDTETALKLRIQIGLGNGMGGNSGAHGSDRGQGNGHRGSGLRDGSCLK